MNCKFHSERESVAKCKICGEELCEECNGVQAKYSACPSCSKVNIIRSFESFRRGIFYNILSVICAAAFLVLYIVELALGKLDTTFTVIAAIIVAVLIPSSVFMFCYSLKKIKNFRTILSITETEKVRKEQENLKKQ